MKVNSNSSDAGTLDIVGRSVSAQYASYAFLILATWTVYQAIFRKKTNAPPGNPPATSIQWLFSIVQRVRFLDQGRNLMHNAWKKYPHRCFKMVTELGELVILPNEYADVIRGDERLNSEEFFEDLFPDNIPELKILRPNPGLFLPLIQTHLIRHLGRSTRPIHEESMFAVDKVLTAAPDWHEIKIGSSSSDLVTRVTTRLFAGAELCRDPKWLEAARDYTIYGFAGAFTMQFFPRFSRKFCSRFNPLCRRAAGLLRQGRVCFEPVLAKRRLEKESGTYVPQDDAIDWMEDSAHKKYDPLDVQISLSAAAIINTTQLLGTVLSHIAANPYIHEPLRREIRQNLQETGMTKATLQNLKLMDSCIRESARVNPLALVQMLRRTVKDVKFPDGTFVPKGSTTVVSASKVWDPEEFENPHKWDGERYYKIRQEEGKQNAQQLVTISLDFMDFGYGKVICPGRFLVADEIKLIMLHILMKYDIKLPEGADPNVKYFGVMARVDPELKLLVRRREVDSEINVDAL